VRIISGCFKGRVLKSTVGPGYRPAMGRVREAIFSMLEARGICWAECSILDLFAGTGSLAYEAISRGSPFAVLVENYPDAVKVLYKNTQMFDLDASQCIIVDKDVLTFLRGRSNRLYEVIFVDPPYGKRILKPTLDLLLRNNWLASEAFIFAEIEKYLKIDVQTIHKDLELIVDKVFGQTRILIWKNR